MFIDFELLRRGRPWRDIAYLTIGMLSIDDRRQHFRDLIAHYRARLIKEGASDVKPLETIWNEQIPRWTLYGLQAWVANMDSWGQKGLHRNERFFAAAEEYGTWKLLGE